jgi:hypothetical protein
MNTVPVEIFAEEPPASRPVQRPSLEQVRVLAETTEFQSRSLVIPTAAPPAPSAPPAPAKRGRKRTGRTVPFACRTTQEAHDRFYRIAEEKNWSCGVTFEQALEALEEKLRG